MMAHTQSQRDLYFKRQMNHKKEAILPLLSASWPLFGESSGLFEGTWVVLVYHVNPNKVSGP